MRSYALTDLEALSDVSKRTIADYVSKGLLQGPSHRGRGARYSQRDLDALRVIPKVRTLMRDEFPSLNTIRAFLARLSPSELHQLAALKNELAFEIEVRRLRVLNRLKNLSPTAAPERISDALQLLTPEQIRGVDRGHFQVGSLVDLDWMTNEPLRSANGYNGHNDQSDRNGKSAVLAEESEPAYANGDAEAQTNGPANGNGSSHDGWASFGDGTVEIRIEKQALMDREAHARISGAIKNFSTRLEEVLKAYG
jgi:DNA-binding transcriptional MerR regulator